ncbi:MAG: hypothetical protein V4535_02575, partial [Bacteroidota bacterium]
MQLFISYRIKDKTVTGYDNWDTTANSNADLVLIGSSRCWAHFDPRFFEETYHLKTINLGMNGHNDMTAIQLRLENYLAKNKAPKYVLLNFDQPAILGSIDKNTNLTGKNYYARFAFLPTKENNDLVNYFKFDNCEKYIPLYALFKYQLFEDCITLKKSNSFPEGFELHDEKWDTIKYPINYVNKKHYFKSNEIKSVTKALGEFDKLCKKSNIKLICIQTPVYKVAYDEKTFAAPKLICDSLKIPFMDVNAVHIRSDINYFYNTMHLNKNGI